MEIKPPVSIIRLICRIYDAAIVLEKSNQPYNTAISAELKMIANDFKGEIVPGLTRVRHERQYVDEKDINDYMDKLIYG